MKKPRDTSLQIRLACIAILGLLIALAAAAYLNGRQVQSDSDFIAEDAVPGTIDAHYMRMAMARGIGGVLVAASVQQPPARESSLENVHEADAAFARALRAYETTIRLHPAEDRTLVERVKTTYGEFYKKRVAYEALILAGNRDGAAAFLESDLLPAFQPAIKAAEEMIQYNHGNSIALSSSIRSGVTQLYWAVAVVVVLALACAVVLVFNLTIRRRELEELRESEEKFSKAFQANPSGIAISDAATGRYIEVNASFCSILGYPMEDVIGYTSMDKGIWSSEEERNQFVQPLLDGCMVRSQEIQIRTRYGVRKTVTLNAELIELFGKRCIMTLIEDVTERRQWERKQAELAAIVESTEDAIISKTLTGVITSWNRGAEKIFGHTAAEAVGQPLLMLFPSEHEDEEVEILASIARGETVEHFETVRIRKDGRRIVISATISPLRDGAGNVVGASKIARDITAQKQAEMRIRQLNRIFAVLSAINKTIVHEKDPQAMLEKACQMAVEKGEFRMAWAAMYDAAAQKVQPVASAGVVDGYLELVNIDLRDKALSSGPSGQAFVTGEHVTCSDMGHDPRIGAWREEALKRGYRSSASFPLKVGGKVKGVFTLYSGTPDFFNDEELLLLDELAVDIGFALEMSENESKRQQAEQELRWRTAFFEAQVHSAIDGILVVDSEGRKLLQNQRMNELWKIPPLIADDTNDSHQIQFILGQVKEPEAFAEKVAHLYAHPDESSSDVIEQVDGTLLERYSAPVRGTDGRYYGRVWTFHDITDLRRKEVRFRRLFESNMEGIFFWKADGSIPEANDAFLRHVGYTREELAAGLINWKLLTPPEYAQVDSRALEEIGLHGICAPYEKEYIRKDGTRVPILIGTSVFEGTPDGVCFILDLTERKKLEQQFLRAQRLESIGTLASGVAHDLNNILAPIMMSMAVLRLGIAEDKRASLFDTIEMSAARGAQIVKQVLTFGRGLEGERHPLQIEMLVTEIEQMIRSTFPKDITVESVVDPHLWRVLGDATQLHQVLLNLCVNARDAMPSGGRLRMSATNLDMDLSYASMLPEATPGLHVLLEVSDTGSGIPPEILERIFDPFFTTKGVGKGTGLGLSTVHGIVKSHGGLLKVATVAGRGTTFQIYLPAGPEQEAVLDAASSGPAPTGHGELVLVVDDEPAITGTARTVLEANGYRVLLANDAAEALVKITQHREDIALVLTDMMMPLMSGVLFVRTLRKMKHSIPVLASTGLCDKAQLDIMKELGIETVLHKPYSSNTLLRSLYAVLHPKV